MINLCTDQYHKYTDQGSAPISISGRCNPLIQFLVLFLPCYTCKFPYLVSDWIGLSQGNEYEPAPGKVYRHSYYHNGVCWSHGNFVARKKRTGWLSFLPAARTLFFFELAGTKDFNGIVTCSRLGMLYFFLDASSLLFLFYTTHLSCMYSLEEDKYSCDLICLHFFILLYKQTS